MSRGRRRRRRNAIDWGRALSQGLLIGAAVFLISLVLAVFGFFTYAKHYLQSERFHRLVEAKLSREFRAKVELSDLRWEGSSAFANRVEAHGYDEAAFSQVGLAGMRAELDLGREHFQRRVWKVPEVTVGQLDVLFSESGRLPGAAAGSRTPEVEEDASGTARRNLVSRLIPRELEVDEVRFNNLNLFWKSPGRKTSATGMQTVVRPTSAENTHRVQVRGGLIQGTEVPQLNIESLDFQWRGREIFLSEAVLRGEGETLVELEGDLVFGEGEDPGSMQLDAEVSRLSLSDLARERGRTRVHGEVEIVARIEGDPNDLENSRQEGTITIRNGVVETLPILEMLARFTQSKRFERIALRDGGGANFVREGGRTTLSDIDFQSDGLGRLTGDLAIEDGDLAGVLQLGVIPGTLKWIPSAEQKIFTDAREGHLWTTVRVSGTVDDPQHDLTPRLASAGVDAAVDMLERLLDGESPAEQPGDEEEKEPAEPDSNRERLGDAVDLGRELLKGFLR